MPALPRPSMFAFGSGTEVLLLGDVDGLAQLAQVGGGFRDFVQGGVSWIKYLEGARG